MCAKGAELRALVAQRLESAAEEIFALFERTFAEYQDEVLRSHAKLLQQTQVMLYKDEIQTVVVGVDFDSDPESVKISQEEVPPLELLPSVTVKSEESVADAAEKNEQEFPGEEPGFSLDSSSENDEEQDTDNSSDWEPTDKSLTHNAQQPKAGHSRNSATDNDEPHQCSKCFRSFTSETNLKQHQHQHHAEKGPVACHICNKLLKHKRTLRTHLRVHTKEKPFSCSSCGQRFRQRKSRERHFKYVHKKEKPFTCAVCQKGFVEKYYFIIHMRTHTGERPFRCSVCGKEFKAEKMLKKHIINHKANGEIKDEELQ